MSKSFKIFRLWRAYYDDLMLAFHKDNPEISTAGYDEILSKFLAAKGTHANGFGQSMENLGHQMIEVVYDFELAQTTWANEHSVDYTSANWETEILLGQINYHRPDIVYLYSLVATPPNFARIVSDNCPFVKLIVAFAGTATPLYFADGVDLLFVGIPFLAEPFKDYGVETHLIYHGFDQSILSVLDQCENSDGSSDNRYPFTFVGSSGFGQKANFVHRYWALVELMIRTNLMGWINDQKESLPHIHNADWSAVTSMVPSLRRKMEKAGSIEEFRSFVAKLVSATSLSPAAVQEFQGAILPTDIDEKFHAQLPLLPLSILLPNSCHAPVFGTEMYKILQKSDLTFNSHASINKGESANMRLFEATGVGTCLISDYGPNISDMFEPDVEIVTYRSVEECIEKVEYLSSRPEERARIAAAGQKRTLTDHSIASRCETIDGHFQRLL